MAITHIQETEDAIRASFDMTMQSPAELRRLAERAALRSHTRELLRELKTQDDLSIGAAAHAVIALRMRHVRDELAAALRGDATAIQSLSLDASPAPAPL